MWPSVAARLRMRCALQSRRQSSTRIRAEPRVAACSHSPAATSAATASASRPAPVSAAAFDRQCSAEPSPARSAASASSSRAACDCAVCVYCAASIATSTVGIPSWRSSTSASAPMPSRCMRLATPSAAEVRGRTSRALATAKAAAGSPPRTRKRTALAASPTDSEWQAARAAAPLAACSLARAAADAFRRAVARRRPRATTSDTDGCAAERLDCPSLALASPLACTPTEDASAAVWRTLSQAPEAAACCMVTAAAASPRDASSAEAPSMSPVATKSGSALSVPSSERAAARLAASSRQ
mmetsp:Transcript_12675/g.48597  ORF Transcript_12675/g.48597 Transcript_12675/m.48597 type:complete len:299 (-) Transcript_12675:396-1292(-)